jgi:hypothetical protein
MPNGGGLCQRSSQTGLVRRSHRTGRRTDSPATAPPCSQGPGSGAPATVCHCGGTGVGPVQVRSWTPSASGLQAHHFGPSGLVLHPRSRRCCLVARGRRGRPEAGWSRHDGRGWGHCPYPRLRRRPYRFPDPCRPARRYRWFVSLEWSAVASRPRWATEYWSPTRVSQCASKAAHLSAESALRRRSPKHPCAKMPIRYGPPLTAAAPPIERTRPSIRAGSVAASTVSVQSLALVGVNNSQCPSEMTSMAPPETLIAVWSSIA